ncbi:MAG TPA: carboxypeptidase-like regulatory domain-containing protein [Bacteroidia bacterium]|jgi:iron complex outermembrane receptor protein|nr:carboxypeptidase-like regulatory domain-containing protein [Bacteroidia bacterium]
MHVFRNVKNTLLSLFLCFIFSTGVIAGDNEPSNKNKSANTKLISGKVSDKQTGEALAAVKVQVNGTNVCCYTDINGNYILSVNPKIAIEISVSLVGYTPITLKTSELGMEKDLFLSPR